MSNKKVLRIHQQQLILHTLSFTHMSMEIHTYKHTHVHTYIYTHTHHTHTHIHAHKHTHILAYTYTFTYIHQNTRAKKKSPKSGSAIIQVISTISFSLTHTYTHTHTHTYTRARATRTRARTPTPHGCVPGGKATYDGNFCMSFSTKSYKLVANLAERDLNDNSSYGSSPPYPTCMHDNLFTVYILCTRILVKPSNQNEAASRPNKQTAR